MNLNNEKFLEFCEAQNSKNLDYQAEDFFKDAVTIRQDLLEVLLKVFGQNLKATTTDEFRKEYINELTELKIKGMGIQDFLSHVEGMASLDREVLNLLPLYEREVST